MAEMGKNLLKNSGNGTHAPVQKDGKNGDVGLLDSVIQDGFSREKEVSLSENARRVLEKRYLIKDKQGEITETADDLFCRVAKNISKGDLVFDAKAEIKASEEKFYKMMTSLQFLPNSPTLMNA
ncbi:MAG: ribonucleotide reductase N-terminal alpha domain-containing protein, partial [Nitrospinota bacterium]